MASLLAAAEIKDHNTAVRVRCGKSTELCRLRLPFEQECARRLQLIFDLCTCDDTVETRLLQIQNLMEVWEWEICTGCWIRNGSIQRSLRVCAGSFKSTNQD